MSTEGYNLFCPVAKACEILEPRWTMLILGEIWNGASRFNEIRRGVPGISPTLLSKRLKEMEGHGLIQRFENRATGDISYRPTRMAEDLAPIVIELGKWAHRHIDKDLTLEHLDAKVLMWNVRRKIDISAMPRSRRSVVQFLFPELEKDEQSYWLIARPGTEVDLCLTDPGHEVDLYVNCDLKALTAAWMGYSTVRREMARDKIVLVGDPALKASFERWMVPSLYAAA